MATLAAENPLAPIAAKVAANALLTDPDTLSLFRHDVLSRGNAPLAVFRPQSVEELAAGITRKLKLNAVFNIQFKDAGKVSYLLEVNPRISGGAPFTARSGLVLPYWAIRLALGTVRAELSRRP